MPETQSTTADDHHMFVDTVLRRALTAPGASSDPAAGRVLARLLAVIAAERDDAVVAPYLAAIPGLDCTFEVRVFQAGDLTPATVSAETGPIAALRAALRLAREGDAGVEVISRPLAVDVERCVLVRDATGEIEFRFPSAETFSGDPDACSVALRAWIATLEAWSEPALVERTSGTVLDVTSLVEGLQPSGDRPVDRLGDGDGRTGGVDFTSVSGMDGLIDAVRQCFAGLTVDVLSRFSESGAVIDALDGFFSNLTIEVDLSQVEQLVRQAVELDRREIVEPIAARVVEMLSQPSSSPRGQAPNGPALSEPNGAAVVVGSDLVAPVPIAFVGPSMPEMAEVVSAQIGALLSETILSRRFGESGGQIAALRGMMAAVEQLDVHLDGLRDEVRRSSSLLTTFDERLEANDRRAATIERVSATVEQEMQRLAHRIDEQVTLMAANAGGGSELADGVSRLTRKLRQSVAQLDRALVRLDELFDEADRPLSDDERRRAGAVAAAALAAAGHTPRPRRAVREPVGGEAVEVLRPRPVVGGPLAEEPVQTLRPRRAVREPVAEEDEAGPDREGDARAAAARRARLASRAAVNNDPPPRPAAAGDAVPDVDSDPRWMKRPARGPGVRGG